MLIKTLSVVIFVLGLLCILMGASLLAQGEWLPGDLEVFPSVFLIFAVGGPYLFFAYKFINRKVKGFYQEGRQGSREKSE